MLCYIDCIFCFGVFFGCICFIFLELEFEFFVCWSKKKYIFYVYESIFKVLNKILINFNEKIYYLYINRFSFYFKIYEMLIFGELYCIYMLKLMCILKIKYIVKKLIDVLEYMVCKIIFRVVFFG